MASPLQNFGQTRQASGQKMTLRRFVSVTFDNFRQLLQTISAPTTSLPMPQILPPSPEDPLPESTAKPVNGTNRPIVTDSNAFGGEQVGDEQPGDEQVGDNAFGEQTAGDQTVGGDTLGKDAPDHDAPGNDAVGSSQEDAPGERDDAHQPQAGRSPDVFFPETFSLASALESLLFVSDEAVEPAQLARAIGAAPAEVEAALLALDAAYRQEGRGLRLQVRNGRYQLVTAPEAANLIETYLNLDASARLSAPALEALAVVAYRQPVTRAQIEAVRGVDCSGVLRSLLQRGLLEEVGRLDAPGRPVLYGVTDLFMHHFGLTALHELPPLEDAEIAHIEEVGA